jgi:hypothetical protein
VLMASRGQLGSPPGVPRLVATANSGPITASKTSVQPEATYGYRALCLRINPLVRGHDGFLLSLLVAIGRTFFVSGIVKGVTRDVRRGCKHGGNDGNTQAHAWQLHRFPPADPVQ